MDKTSLLLLALFGTAITLLLVAGVIGIQQWRARRVVTRQKALASTF